MSVCPSLVLVLWLSVALSALARGPSSADFKYKNKSSEK